MAANIVPYWRVLELCARFASAPADRDEHLEAANSQFCARFASAP